MSKVYTIEELKAIIIPIAKKYGIKKVYLFGSMARGDGNENSDIDLRIEKGSLKGLFALDNLWDGLGALTVVKPNVKYLFGKMTMYPSYNRFGRDMILYFLKKHFSDKEDLITPVIPLQIETDEAVLQKIFCYDTFKEDYKVLNKEVRKLGYNIPPLVNAYMNLSPTMRMFGTAINDGFGMVEETGILIAVDEILEEKRVRHIESYMREHPEALRITSGANPVVSESQSEKQEDIKG